MTRISSTPTQATADLAQPGEVPQDQRSAQGANDDPDCECDDCDCPICGPGCC
jgi:hypothetical protein